MQSSVHISTAESVTEGHPDKVADRVSDAVLDAALRDDPGSRVACETLVTEGMAVIAGEVTTKAQIDVPEVVRETASEIGYTRAELGFAADGLRVEVLMHPQSPEIAWGVDRAADASEEAGAGDQGVMIGYAARETDELMPLPIHLAHALAAALAEARHLGRLPFLRPDGKTQIAVRYEDGRPVEVVRVLISAQHDPGIESERLRGALWETVVLPTLPEGLFDAVGLREAFTANPTGSFTHGGPAADTGLTGRKTIVDTYGGAARHGGGSFSGKDASKSTAPAPTRPAGWRKNLVAAGLARRCEVEVSYAIGTAEPFSLRVESFGTAELPDERLVELVGEVWDLRPGALRRDLDLNRPIYRPLAAYGHFGRPELDVPWERLDRVDELAELV